MVVVVLMVVSADGTGLVGELVPGEGRGFVVGGEGSGPVAAEGELVVSQGELENIGTVTLVGKGTSVDDRARHGDAPTCLQEPPFRFKRVHVCLQETAKLWPKRRNAIVGASCGT